VTLVSADRDLNAAATAEGLPVDDPNLHPWPLARPALNNRPTRVILNVC
jgi:hypothetical protein